MSTASGSAEESVLISCRSFFTRFIVRSGRRHRRRRRAVKFPDPGVMYETNPEHTIKKSSRFQNGAGSARRYAPGCRTNPRARIFSTISAVNSTWKVTSARDSKGSSHSIESKSGSARTRVAALSRMRTRIVASNSSWSMTRSKKMRNDDRGWMMCSGGSTTLYGCSISRVVPSTR
eukprot:gene10891-biopygen10917